MSRSLLLLLRATSGSSSDFEGFRSRTEWFPVGSGSSLKPDSTVYFLKWLDCFICGTIQPKFSVQPQIFCNEGTAYIFLDQYRRTEPMMEFCVSKWPNSSLAILSGEHLSARKICSTPPARLLHDGSIGFGTMRVAPAPERERVGAPIYPTHYVEYIFERIGWVDGWGVASNCCCCCYSV